MNGRHDSNRPQEREPSFLEEMKRKIPGWITNGISKDAVEYAEKLGQHLKQQRYSSSQIRNIFGEIKRLEMQRWSQETETSLLLLKPKLAYGVARQTMRDSKNAASDLTNILSIGIDTIIDSDKKEAAFKNFSRIFEAVLAYHKAYGGK